MWCAGLHGVLEPGEEHAYRRWLLLMLGGLWFLEVHVPKLIGDEV